MSLYHKIKTAFSVACLSLSVLYGGVGIAKLESYYSRPFSVVQTQNLEATIEVMNYVKKPEQALAYAQLTLNQLPQIRDIKTVEALVADYESESHGDSTFADLAKMDIQGKLRILANEYGRKEKDKGGLRDLIYGMIYGGMGIYTLLFLPRKGKPKKSFKDYFYKM